MLRRSWQAGLQLEVAKQLRENARKVAVDDSAILFRHAE